MKTCSKCSEVKEESDYRPTRSGKSLMAMCADCVRRIKRAEMSVYRANNKGKIAAATVIYNSTHRELRRLAGKRHRLAKPETVRNQRRRRQDRSRAELRRGYILLLLCGKLHTPYADVPASLIELKREQILNTRLQTQLIETIGEAL